MIDTKYIREKILDLAVRGKLVDQDPKDGDARDLLEEIQKEKEELIKAKKIKKEKTIDFVEQSLIYEIPESWEWTKARNVFYIQRGGSPRPIKKFLTTENGINWMKIGDVGDNDKYITSAKEKIIESGIAKSRLINPGDLILTNSMSYGRPYISKIKGCIHDGWLVLSPYSNSINKEYFYYLIKSPYMQKSFNLAAKGAVVKNLNIDKVKEIFLPLPPLAEQKRIVEKIEEAFALLDEIEEAQDQITSLGEQIKSKVLDMAVRGELVPQDPSDGNAKDLLREIQVEKENLIKAKKIKKEKKLPEIREEAIPFEIPDSWVWARLGDIGNWSAGSTPSRKNPNFYRGNIPWIKTGDLNNNFIKESSEYITEEAFAKNSLRLNPIGSVLIAMYGATIGKLGILQIEATTNQACCACIPYQNINSLFLFYFLMARKKHLISLGSGGAQPNISRTIIVSELFPLPPLAEQKRIVEKIEEIFAAVDAMIN